MTEVWNGSENFSDEPMADGTYIRVNGSNVAIDPGTPFAVAVTSAAKSAGMGKFRVFENGDEIRPKDAKDRIIAEGTALELRPYDVAG